jgi:predicted metal-dependent hydrolase
MPRIQDAARAVGYEFEAVTDPGVLGVVSEYSTRRIPLTEPLEGPDAQLVRHLSESQPALIIVDLNSEAIPWARWIQVIKTSSATRRIPIIAFGPHVREDDLEIAKAAGADFIIRRGKFQSSLQDLIAEWARPSVLEDVQKACDGELSERARQGIALHNAKSFFEAHEELEIAWMEAPEHEGFLYRALLQVTVAFLHLERGNLRGVKKMLLRVHQWLDPLPDRCRDVNIRQVRATIDRLREEIDQASAIDDLPPMAELYQPFEIFD